MKTRIMLLTVAAASALLTVPRVAAAPATHDDDHLMFYSDLSPYGEWVELEPGLVVWRPFGVYDGWRPYSVGRWVWTRYGWYWMSDEPYGWAVFHYGRWAMHPRYGWIWYPGRVWGPAWVEWRYSDDYIGWAPLPPFAVFHVSFGIRFTRHWVAPTYSWCFVRYSSFGGPIYRDRIMTEDRVQRIIGTTRRGRTASIDRDVIVNRGVDREMVERRGSIRIDRYDVTGSTRDRSERLRDGRIEVYRPDQDAGRFDRSPRSEPQGRSRDMDIRQRDTRREAPREFSRPEQDRRQITPQRSPGSVPDRRIAPNVRSRPERSSSSPSRTPDRSGTRKRDH